MTHRRLTVRWKMFFILLGFMLTVLGMLWFSQLVLMDDFFRAGKNNELKTGADTITANIDNENLDALIERICYFNDVSVRIIDREGTVLHTADAKYSTVSHLTTASLLERFSYAKENNGYYYESVLYENYLEDDEEYPFEDADHIGEGNIESLIYTAIIKNAAGDELCLIMDTTVTPHTSTTRSMIFQLSIISAFVLISTVIIVLIFSKYVADPITSLIPPAKELAKGKSNIKFIGGGYKEVDELCEALNYASKEISEVEHLRQELIANVSHDLKTPLTLIKGYSEMMRDIPSEMTPDNLQTVIDETERLTNLVNDILNLSRVQEMNTLTPERFDINLVTEEIIARHEKLLRSQGYTIEYGREENLFVYADRIKISQVIYNLMSNAVNYAGEDKKIIVRLYPKNKNVRLEIIDHGPGIDVEILPHIWDRYYKSDKSHRRAAIGTGLGLSIIKTIMTRHPGGVYGVESSLGHGSNFYIELPRIK